MKFDLSVTDGTVYLVHDGATLSGTIERWPLQPA
jgi:hypothetical protein